MLPADLVATAIAHLPIFSGYEDDPAVRSIVVSYQHEHSRQHSHRAHRVPLSAPACVSVKEAIAGVLALLFCTTHLHYTQNMQENNYIMVLTLAGFSFQYEWLRTGSRRALLIGSAAFGLNLLTRLTTGLDLIAGGIFLLLLLWFDACGPGTLAPPSVDYCKIAAPVCVFFLLIDRVYKYYRFGSFTIPTLPSSRANTRRATQRCPPTSHGIHRFTKAFFGALFAPEKSIFLFDPLLVLAVLLLVVLWKRLSPKSEPTPSLPCCCWPPTLLFMRDTRSGRAISPGATAMFRLRSNWSRCSPCRCCCAIGRNLEPLDLARGLRFHRRQFHHSDRLARLLAAAGDLPDGDARPSDIRDRLALEEYRGVSRSARWKHGD